MHGNKGKLVAGATVAMVALAACGGGGGSGGGSETAETAEGGGNASGSLTIMVDAERTPAMEELAAQFAEENGVQVEVQSIAENTQSQFLTAVEAGEGPDLLIGAHDWIGNLVQNGAIAPVQLPENVVSDLNPVAVEAVTFDGQTYGVPFAVESVVLFRNTELVPEAPATVEELVTTGQQLVDAGQASEVLALPVGEVGDAYHMHWLYRSAGGYLFGQRDDGSYDKSDFGLDDPEAVQAFERIAELGEAGQGVLKRSITGDNIVDLFTSGAAPFMVSGPWQFGVLEDAEVPFEISPVPGFEGADPARPFVGVQAMYVASDSENKTLAQEFATNFFTRPEVGQAMFEADPRPPASQAVLDQVNDDNPLVQQVLDALVDGEPMPSIPEMAAVFDPLGKAEAAIVGGADVRATVTATAATIAEAIE